MNDFIVNNLCRRAIKKCWGSLQLNLFFILDRLGTRPSPVQRIYRTQWWHYCPRIIQQFQQIYQPCDYEDNIVLHQIETFLVFVVTDAREISVQAWLWYSAHRLHSFENHSKWSFQFCGWWYVNFSFQQCCRLATSLRHVFCTRTHTVHRYCERKNKLLRKSVHCWYPRCSDCCLFVSIVLS